jgi:hypothetical protein
MGCSWKPPQTIVENDRLAPTGPVVEVHKQAFGVSRFFYERSVTPAPVAPIQPEVEAIIFPISSRAL